MGAKVRYILGAGASYGAVPTVEEMPKRLVQYYGPIDDAMKIIHGYGSYDVNQHKETLLLLKKEFTGLHTELQRSFSFDTLAKFYWATNSAKYSKLKALICLIIQLESEVNANNPRYDAFLAALAIEKGGIKSLENIQIVNWNYDYQFKMSIEKLFGSRRSVNMVQKNLNMTYINGHAVPN